MKKLLRTLIIVIALLFISKINFGQPMLKSAGNFVVFTSTGAVKNVGNSHLTGNVGGINGAVDVGINIDGVMHVDDGAATTAAQDLLTAYTDLNMLTPTAPPLSPVIGNNTSLTAGVYRINEAAGFLNGNLTLDGNGDPNALFIFQIKGTFNSSANSKVILINKAVACNVFWVTEGAVDIGSGTIMKGNVIANNSALNIGSDVNLEGRFFSTTGAISFTNLTAYMPLGCSVPILNGPSAPVIGSTVCYALFSKSGLVTNSGAGTTTITGDVGTNFGATAGYQASNVNGTIHSVPNASTQAAGDDLLVFNNYFNNLVTDIQLLYPASFGSGLVLTPHTYLLNGATTLTGTVTLNAQDNPNAIFVIKVNGPFTTISSAKVLLINGAQAKNVYWKVTSAVDISTLSDFKGTVVSNAAINFGAGSILEGRALTTNGAITTNSVTAAITAGCSTLPITGLYFNGKVNQGNVTLEWATASEINNNYFNLFKSTDGLNYQHLANIKSLGNSNSTQKYYFIDKYPTSGNNYYKLVQTDLDGTQAEIGVKTVKFDLDQSGSLSVYPNPVTDNLNIGFEAGKYDTMKISDLLGRTIISKSINKKDKYLTINVEKLVTGSYIINLKGNGGFVSKQFIKN